MALTDQIDVVNCQQGVLLGTGNEACPFSWNRVTTLEFSPKSFVYENEQTLSEVQTLQQQEILTIVNGIKTFALVPLEPNVNTADGSGYKTVTGELPYEYEVMFESDGVNIWKALRSMNSKQRFNVAFYDVDGNKIFTQNKNGSIKGFSIQMLFTGQYQGFEGNNPEVYKMSIQLSDISEMDRQAWITADNLDFNADSELDGVNDIIFTPSTLAVAATTLVVKSTLIDKSHFVAGLVQANFRVQRNGVTVAVSGVVADANAKTYTLTIPAVTAGTYTVETYDTTSQVKTILQTGTGLLFRSNTATVIAV